MLEAGITNRMETMVSRDNVAGAVGSGTVEVFATPEMINLMERCCSESVGEFLEEGCTTVGSLVNVTHLSATPIGMRVWCESTLTQVEGRKLVFQVKAFDEKGIIGEGVHERFIINVEKFMAKTMRKLEG